MENKYPKRKNIRSKEYDYSQNGGYFITFYVEDIIRNQYEYQEIWQYIDEIF